jgi:hypothetical protein
MNRARRSALLRAAAPVAVLALLAACSGQTPRPSAKQEAARYLAHARSSYTPPGPAQDPWGPYIKYASKRFDVPELWIRSVMRVESGGNQYLNGQLTTSGAGAMGLMQVMPATYDELRERYNLGDDPYNPQDNILAGTAYMREMYDIYGSPGFLAAYNAGPGRLDDYLSNNRALPDETRRYVAMIGPNIVGVYPSSRSPAENYAMNALPIDIPSGKRYGKSVQLASRHGGGGRTPVRGPIEVAQLPEPPRGNRQSSSKQYATAAPPSPPPRGGFRIISQANAAEAPARHIASVSGHWAIQVGAYSNSSQAHAALGSARQHARDALADARSNVSTVRQARHVLYRARMTGLSRDAAVQACERLARGRNGCIVLSPDSQS